MWRSLKKLKIELPYHPAIALLGIYPKDVDVVKRRALCTPMFIAALSTIAKLWKERRCTSTGEWKKKIWCICICVCIYIYIFNGILLSYQKDRILNICCNMDGTGGGNAKQNKSSREKKLSYGFTHLWNIRGRKIGRGRKG